MVNTSKLESTIKGWYGAVNIPHLPKTAQEWLADNVWWLALVGVILSVLGLLVLIPLFFAAIAVTTVVTTATLGYSAITTSYGGLFWLSALISIVSYVVTTVLLIMAINPLKAKLRKGWRLVFVSYLITFSLAVVGDLLTLNIFGIVSALLGAAVAGYFLFEIEAFFGARHKTQRHTKATAK